MKVGSGMEVRGGQRQLTRRVRGSAVSLEIDSELRHRHQLPLAFDVRIQIHIRLFVFVSGDILTQGRIALYVLRRR